MSASTSKNKPLDPTDWQILELLQANARMSYNEIAAHVHLTAPAVIRRVRRLEENGYIRGYRADVDMGKVLDHPISVFIQMVSDRAKEKQLQENLSSFPEIIECHLMSSTIDFVIRAQVSSVEHLNELLARLGEYGETDSAIVLETIRDQSEFKPD